MNIGLIDADLIDNGTRHPNLALMKISGYMKNNGHQVSLLLDYDNLNNYDEIYISKVFSFTKIPIDLNDKEKYSHIKFGGTGFFPIDPPNLPDEIEHFMPDYTLYNSFIAKEIERGLKPSRFDDYINYSIGFTTRGCFRKCDFCVNKKYNSVFRHSLVSEFLDKNRKYIYLWDDNFLAYSGWEEVLDELDSTNKKFQFRQGLDIRLMTKKKAERLAKSNYHGDFIFAFDFLKDRELIEKNLKLWRKFCNKTTKLYVLCGFESITSQDIADTFERIKILMKYQCIPYIMRYASYESSEFRGMYINLARWCNQPQFFKKKTFREFCEANGENSSTMKYLRHFEEKHPDIASLYFNLRYSDFS